MIRSYLVALCLCVSLWFAVPALAGCPGDPKFDPHSVLHLASTPLQPRYFHNVSTAQIESMRHAQFHNKMMHNPGLTLAEQELKSDYQMGGMRRGRTGEYCIWVESLSLDFSYKRMDVYISSQYPEGSCQYNVILGHENQHVDINNRTLQIYYSMMRKALWNARSIPTKAKPLPVRSLSQGKAILTRRINGILNPLNERFKKAVRAENAKIDTIANYRATQAKCSSW